MAKSVDNTPIGSINRYEFYVWDGDDIVMDFVDADGGGTPAATLSKRYLWGQAVDQVLAEETAGGATVWDLADNLGSVRDLMDNTSALVSGSHVNYDAFGKPTATPLSRFAFTGQEYDADAGMYYYNARWYNPATGKYISEDPTEFGAGDTNLARMVGNSPTNAVDPTGMVVWFGPAAALAAGVAAIDTFGTFVTYAQLIGNPSRTYLANGVWSEWQGFYVSVSRINDFLTSIDPPDARSLKVDNVNEPFAVEFTFVLEALEQDPGRDDYMGKYTETAKVSFPAQELASNSDIAVAFATKFRMKVNHDTSGANWTTGTLQFEDGTTLEGSDGCDDDVEIWLQWKLSAKIWYPTMSFDGDPFDPWAGEPYQGEATSKTIQMAGEEWKLYKVLSGVPVE